MPRRRVGIIGSGLIGRSWAIVFLRGGCEVLLHDADAGQTEKALKWIESSLSDMEQEGLIGNAEWLRGFVKPAATMAEAVASADYVQESVAELIEVKHHVLAELDRLTPIAAVIGSSTSAFMPSLLFGGSVGAPPVCRGASDEPAAFGTRCRDLWSLLHLS